MKTQLLDRRQIPDILVSRGLTGSGVEVGAGSGEYSDYILGSCALKRLFSVDPWSKPEGSTVRHLGDPSLYLQAVQKLMRHGLRSVVLRMESLEAVSLFRDRSLDFVYIDANHDYESISRDIRAWSTKIAPGGLLSGHDYSETIFDVKLAVDEFVQKHDLQFELTVLDQTTEQGDKIQSWMIWY